MAYPRTLAGLVWLAILAAAPACVQEDWGGPKGPPLAGSEASPLPGGVALLPADAGTLATPGPTSPRATAGETSETSASFTGSPTAPNSAGADAPSSFAAGTGDSGSGSNWRVEASLSGGKIPGFDDAIAGMRSTLKACVDGKGGPNARVEITARIGPKGTVLKSDKVGGSSFSQGAVPCLMRRIEAAQFKKPTEGSPRITFRVRMSSE